MHLHFLGMPLCGLTLLFCGPLQGQRPASPSEVEQATLFETQADIKAFSKRLENASNDLELADATVDLGALYLRIVSDTRFPVSRVLQSQRGRVATKLQQACKLIKRAGNRDAPAASRYVNAAHEESTVGEMEAAIVDRQWQLAAHAVGGTGPMGYYASGMHGTSGYLYRGRGGGIQDDNGDELVDLIRTIIHPDFWQINGGPGRAYYYQPLRIIVVRATMRVHEDITNLLERLR